MILEEVVGALHDLLLDLDALLGLQLVDQRLDILRRRYLVVLAVNDETRRRAGGEEGEVVEVRLRGDRDEALDLGPAHEKLHADPGAEREACDPAAAGVGMDRLHPIERGGSVRQLARAVIELALAAADAAEVEAQDREAALREHVKELVDDLVVHRPAELGMRV